MRDRLLPVTYMCRNTCTSRTLHLFPIPIVPTCLCTCVHTASAEPLTGTSSCTARPYLRTSGALPSTRQVWPLPGLRRALAAVRLRAEGAELGPTAEWAAEAEQLRAIRQDVTVQHLQDSEFARELYALNAELAWRHDDLAQFDPSAAQLAPLHDNPGSQAADDT